MEIQGNKGICIYVEVGYDSYAVFHTKEGLPELVAHKQNETTLEDLDQLVSLITELVNNKKDRDQVTPEKIREFVKQSISTNQVQYNQTKEIKIKRG